MATVNSIAPDNVVLQRLETLIVEQTSLAWKMHNTVAFMARAIPDDEADGLPVQCALVDLRCDLNDLATSLMGLVHEARHAQAPSDE